MTAYFIESNDGGRFELSTEATKLSCFLSVMCEDATEDELNLPVDLPSKIISRVANFLNHYAEAPFAHIERPLKCGKMKEIVPEWFADFAESQSFDEIQELALAANMMDIPSLMELSTCKMALFLYERRCNDIPKIFGVNSNFTEGEEKNVYLEFPWAKTMAADGSLSVPPAANGAPAGPK